MMKTAPSLLLARWNALRAKMREQQCVALLLTDADPHGSEYVAAHWQWRTWASGFTGSAGTFVLTADAAALWTDSRYWLQAADELAELPVQIMHDGAADTPSIADWLSSQLEDHRGTAPLGIAVWSDILPYADYVQVQKTFSPTFTLVPLPSSLWASLWPDRPPLPTAPAAIQPLAYAGWTAKEKMAVVVRQLLAKDAHLGGYLLGELSEIAWLLNLRGADIPYNPLLMSYVYLSMEGEVWLMVAPSKINERVRTYLDSQGVTLADIDYLPRLLDEQVAQGKRIGLSPQLPYALCRRVPAEACSWLDSPVPLLKAEKNNSEQEGFRHAMERDGVAMVRFFQELETTLGTEEWTELRVDKRLTALRAEGEKFKSLSFATIAAYGPHGAVVHYEASPDTDVRLEARSLLLLDSGAQYLDGTTDLTRTWAMGELTAEERQVYTLVLKGHIGLSSLRFPLGTTGLAVDLAARRDLWAAGYDFGHGTGHGVGAYLCVHEGPFQIRKEVRPDTLVGLRPGMVVSNEPGIYIPQRFGVRLENLLLVVPDGKNAFGEWCRFEVLTLCPFDLRPLVVEWLTPNEISWLDTYHAQVRERLLPKVKGDVAQWLLERTQPVAVQCNLPTGKM